MVLQYHDSDPKGIASKVGFFFLLLFLSQRRAMTTTVSRTTRTTATAIPPAMAPAEFAPSEEEGWPETVDVGSCDWVPESTMDTGQKKSR